MILDNNLVFSNAQTLITNASTASTFVLDMATGVCTSAATFSAPNLSFGNAALFGEDMGVGTNLRPYFFIGLGATFLTASSATLNIAIQGAPDLSTNAGNISSLVWTTYAETGAVAAAGLLINTAFKMPWPLRPPGVTMPRFMRLLYQLPAATSFTAGSITMAAVTLNPDQWNAQFYPSNFVVGA